jgi:hypothetical protein
MMPPAKPPASPGCRRMKGVILDAMILVSSNVTLWAGRKGSVSGS